MTPPGFLLLSSRDRNIGWKAITAVSISVLLTGIMGGCFGTHDTYSLLVIYDPQEHGKGGVLNVETDPSVFGTPLKFYGPGRETLEIRRSFDLTISGSYYDDYTTEGGSSVSILGEDFVDSDKIDLDKPDGTRTIVNIRMINYNTVEVYQEDTPHNE